MTTVRDLIEEIKGLRGAEVSIFGQPCKLADSVDECTIDIIDVLNSLDGYEINLEDYMDYNSDNEDEESIFNDDDVTADEIIDKLIEYDYCYHEYDKWNNSYNWSSPVSNDFDYQVFKGDFTYIVFKVHRFGDVRSNYTDEVVLQFNSLDEFYEIMFECSKYIEVEVDGIEYNVDINVWSDSYEVYNTDGKYIGSAFGELEDVKELIKEKIEEA